MAKKFFQEKYGSRVKTRNALGQSDRSILEIVISREPFMLKISKNSKKSKKILGNHFWQKKIFFANGAPNLFKKGILRQISIFGPK